MIIGSCFASSFRRSSPGDDDCTLHDFVFTVRIHEPGGSSSFEWSGSILDPESGVQLWTDAEAPDWCTDPDEDDDNLDDAHDRLASLKVDLLVSRMMPRGLRTIRLCGDVQVDDADDGEICFDESMPMSAAATAVAGLQREGGEYEPAWANWVPGVLFRPWITHSKIGGGSMETIFRDEHEYECIAPDVLLTYLKHMAPWGDADCS